MPPRQFMLPDAQHPPPGFAERPRHQPVPRLIPRELLFPKGPVAFRHRRMLRAPMPETAIDEDDDPLPAKRKIRSADDRQMPPPAGDRMRAQEFGESDFGILVASPLY